MISCSPVIKLNAVSATVIEQVYSDTVTAAQNIYTPTPRFGLSLFFPIKESVGVWRPQALILHYAECDFLCCWLLRYSGSSCWVA